MSSGNQITMKFEAGERYSIIYGKIRNFVNLGS